jgi:hypothetical protein
MMELSHLVDLLIDVRIIFKRDLNQWNMRGLDYVLSWGQRQAFVNTAMKLHVP